MVIGIDCRLWGQSGVGRYIRNLVFNLIEIDKKNYYVIFVRDEDLNLVQSQIAKFKIQNSKFKIVPVNISWHSFSAQLRFPKIIEKEKVDLMHFPYFDVPFFYKKPFVITIHDLIYHHFVSGQASSNPLWIYGFKILAYRLVIKNAARRANKIIAVSEFTKRDIINTLGVKNEKIESIYEAADDLPEVKAVKPPINDYILYVGNVYSHKNVPVMIRAFKKIAMTHKIKILFVGGDDFFYKKLKNKIKDLVKLGIVQFDHNADDQKLINYYRNAICLIRPSFMEGFSLPPLEAFANKCLVIASDIPVHQEVLGNVPIYFDPNDDNDLAEKIKLVLNMKESEKNDIKEKGFRKSKDFSWEKTAQQTLRVYNNL